MSAVTIPEDLVKALESDAYIHEYFMGLPPSHKREYVRWVNEAKRPETRTRRIHQTLERLRAKQHEVGRE